MTKSELVEFLEEKGFRENFDTYKREDEDFLFRFDTDESVTICLSESDFVRFYWSLFLYKLSIEEGKLVVRVSNELTMTLF